jgi:hypothetical protein
MTDRTFRVGDEPVQIETDELDPNVTDYLRALAVLVQRADGEIIFTRSELERTGLRKMSFVMNSDPSGDWFGKIVMTRRD